MKALTAGLEQNSKATLLTKMQAINNQNRMTVNELKKISFYTITEESYGDTRSVFISKETRNTGTGERSTYDGMWAFIYRDTYGIALSGEGFTTEQELKGSIGQLESCMKKAADAHAARQSGTSGPAPAGVTQPGLAGAGTTPDGEEEESLDDLLKDLGDEINEDLPLPVNWTAVPDALGNSVTPAAAGAVGALIGGIAGAVAVLISGLPWPAGSSGGGGSEPPGGQPVPETGVPVQEPGEGTPAAGSPATLPAEPALAPPTEPPAVPSGPDDTVMAEPGIAPAGSAAVTPLTEGLSPETTATAAAAPVAPPVLPGIDPVTGKRVLTPDEEDLRDFIRQTNERNARVAAEWSGVSEVAGWYETGAKAVTTAADITIDIGSVLAPGTGSTIKNIYSATKTMLSRASESYHDGEGFWWGMGKGAVEAAADKALDLVGGTIADKYKGKIPLFGKFEAPKGVDLGNVTPAELCKQLLGDKTPSYIADQARETMANALANFAQGKIQGRVFCDPIKRMFGISKPE